MEKYTTISIPIELHEKVKTIIEGTDFTSVGEFTKFLLRTVASGGHIKNENISQNDINLVKKRLKELGYL